MKAPDKIYIDPNVQIGWFRGERPSELFREYIRKDLLLKWARELKHVYELPISSSGKVGRISLAKAEVLQLIIDKLNSL